MRYGYVERAKFIIRHNRFIAEVQTDSGDTTRIHVKNTGRCRELLLPGVTVYIEKAAGSSRKTPYDLIAVEKETERGTVLVNIDSQAPNKAAAEWLKGGLFSTSAILRPEVKYGNSRFDFYVEDGDKKAFVEVKGVTLEVNGAVLFPDAPTERGVKHLGELCHVMKEGYEAYVLFVVQMSGAKSFSPNRKTHPEFADALKKARDCGVRVLVYECDVKADEMKITKQIKEIII